MAFDAAGIAARLRKAGISVTNRGSGKARIGIRPKRASTVLKPKKGKTKLSSMAGDQAALEYRSADSPDKTGAPSSPTKKRGDVPSREDVTTYPKSEARSDVRTTIPIDPLFQIEGFAGPTKSAAEVKLAVSRDWVYRKARAAAAHQIDKGFDWERMHPDRVPKASIAHWGREPVLVANALKERANSPKHMLWTRKGRENQAALKRGVHEAVAEAFDRIHAKQAEDRSLGDQTKRWESPTRPEPGLSTPDRHRIHGNGDNKYIQLSDISTSAGQDESDTKRAMVEELGALGVLSEAQLSKLAAISDEAAITAYKRLGKLEKERPTPGQVARGAAVGSVVAPTAALASRLVAGRKASGGLGPYRGARDLAAQAMTGSFFGGVMPAVRHDVERRHEIGTLKKYVKERE